DPPTPNGGTIIDGTYYMTAVDWYTGLGGRSGVTDASVSQVFVLEAGVAQVVGSTADGGTSGAFLAVTTSGTTMIWSSVCPPDGGDVVLPYGTDDAGAF